MQANLFRNRVRRQWSFLGGCLLHYRATEYSKYKGLNGSQIIKRKLEENKIRHVFGYPGGQALYLIDELHASKAGSGNAIQYITNSCEISTGYAAEGYARASGKTAVVITTSGPSVTYLLPSLMDAYIDGVSVLAITGQVPTSSPPEAFQECPVVDITNLFTKWNFKVTDISQLPCALDTAFSEAMRDRPGPVVMDCPSDMYSHVLDEEVKELIAPKEDHRGALPPFPFLYHACFSFGTGFLKSMPHVNKLLRKNQNYYPKPRKTVLPSVRRAFLRKRGDILDALNKYIPQHQAECIITSGAELKHSFKSPGITSTTPKFHHLSSGEFRTNGAPIGFAIGAKVACPDSTVICIDEQNSFNLTSTELRTVIRHGINIKIILLDLNSSSRMDEEGKMFFEERRLKNKTRNIDYRLLAESYNIKSLHCNNFDDLGRYAEEFIDYKGPILFHVGVSE